MTWTKALRIWNARLIGGISLPCHGNVYDIAHERNGPNKKSPTAGCRKRNRERRRASRSSWNFAARSRETHFLPTVTRYSIYQSTIKSLPPPCPRHWSSRGNAILFEDSPAIVTISFARRHTKDARRTNERIVSSRAALRDVVARHARGRNDMRLNRLYDSKQNLFYTG